MANGDMHGGRRGPIGARGIDEVRYRDPRPVLGTVLVVLGIPATIAGFALLMIYGENMALDGLGAFALCFGGVPAATIGVLLFRRGPRQPGFRQDYVEPDAETRRTLHFHAIGAPLIGLGLAGIVCARPAAAALGAAASGPLAWTIFVAGIAGVLAGGKMLAMNLPGPLGLGTAEDRSPSRAGTALAALALLLLAVLAWLPLARALGGLAFLLVAAFAAGLLMMAWPGDPRPTGADYEARFSRAIAGWLTGIGVVAIPTTAMTALSSDADPDTAWSMAIMFVAFGIAFAAFGGRLLRDRRVLLRADDQGLFWRKLGTIPWSDVIRAHVRVGRRIRSLALTVRERDGTPVSFGVDIMGVDRDFRELGAALGKRGVPPHADSAAAPAKEAAPIRTAPARSGPRHS